MISTWSAKIDDDQKEKLQNLIDGSGLSSKDFLENMITLYELNESKVRVKEISEDISEVQQLTLRMNNIFINVAERIESIKSYAEADKIRALEEKQNIITALTEKVSLLSEKIKTSEEEKEYAIREYDRINNEIVNLKNMYDKDVNQFTEVNRNNQQLIAEYKEKIDNLSSLVAEFQDKAKQNSELQQQLLNSENELNNLKRINEGLKNIENENVNLVEQVKTLENELNNKTIFINDLQRSFDDLQRKVEGDKEKLELDAEKKLIKAEKIYNESLQKIQEDYNKKLFEFLSEFNKPANSGTKKSKTKEVKKEE